MFISTESAVRDKETKLKLKTEKVAKESKTEEKVRPIPTVTELKKQQSEGESRYVKQDASQGPWVAHLRSTINKVVGGGGGGKHYPFVEPLLGTQEGNPKSNFALE